MRETLTVDDSSALVDLWRRRQRLSPADMGRMYAIVSSALQGCNPPELHVLGEGRQELIAQFIYVKVLRLDAKTPDAADETPAEDDGHSAPSSSFALCAYFRRYLIDCTRSSAFRRKVSLGDQIAENQLDEQQDPDDDIGNCLAEHGLTPERVSLSARSFIATLAPPERILLCESFGREATGGLSGVASRHAIASYHYRAGRLGLVHKREGLVSDYAKTQLGQWIQQGLGIPIHPENMRAIHSVFKILGVEASYA